MKVIRIDSIETIDQDLIEELKRPVLILVDPIPDVSELLLAIYKSYIKGGPACIDFYEKSKNTLLNNLIEAHELNQRLIQGINDLLVEVEWIVEDEIHDQHDYIYDQIICTANLISSLVGHHVLNTHFEDIHYLDARDVICSEGPHRNGVLDLDKSIKRLSKLNLSQVHIAASMLASTSDNNSVILQKGEMTKLMEYYK